MASDTPPEADLTDAVPTEPGTGVAIVLTLLLAVGAALVCMILEVPPWSWLVDAQVAVLGASYPKYTATLLAVVLVLPVGVVVQGLRVAVLAALRRR